MKPPFYGIPTPVPEIDFLYDDDQELEGVMWGQPPRLSGRAGLDCSALQSSKSYVGMLSPSAVVCEAFGKLSLVMA
jgi:hypothetical protein